MQFATFLTWKSPTHIFSLSHRHFIGKKLLKFLDFKPLLSETLINQIQEPQLMAK